MDIRVAELAENVRAFLAEAPSINVEVYWKWLVVDQVATDLKDELSDDDLGVLHRLSLDLADRSNELTDREASNAVV